MDAGEVFELCISRVRNHALKARLEAIRPEITQAAADYDDAASTASLQNFPRLARIGTVTKDELMNVYSGRMAKEGQPGRDVYDKLMTAAPRRECPLCGSGKVMTLDHHLPKSEYPVLAVLPTNLVPSCYWCQRSKKQSYPTTAEEQTLHPYYDDFELETWLRATVNTTSPASFTFYVDPPADWDAIVRERLTKHTEAFELFELFSINAASELVIIRHRLNELFLSGGADEVRRHLIAEAASRQAGRLNSWETAMYVAAASSDWFCDGGFAVE